MILRVFHDPTAHFLDRGGRSENGPRLPLGNGAAFGPKVPYFIVHFLAGTHRLRSTAPDMRESSIALSDPGYQDGGANLRGKTLHF